MEQKERPDHDIDLSIRESLDAHPAVVERLVKNALAENEASIKPRPRWTPRFAAAGLVLAALWIAVFVIPRSPSPEKSTIITEAPPTVETEAPTQRARLTISNTGGDVTITSEAGTQWIILTGDPS